MSDWNTLMCSHVREAFRLETFAEYKVRQEEADLALWRREGLTASSLGQAEYWAQIRDRVAHGARHIRMRVLDDVLTPYQKFEIGTAYWPLTAIGAQVLCLSRTDFNKHFPGSPSDFWLFDEAHALQMNYESDGTYVSGLYRNDDAYLKDCIMLKEKLMQRALPLGDYLQDYFKL